LSQIQNSSSAKSQIIKFKITALAATFKNGRLIQIVNVKVRFKHSARTRHIAKIQNGGGDKLSTEFVCIQQP